MTEKVDWWGIVGGAMFGVGSSVTIWPEMTVFSMAKIPPIVLDFPLRIIFTIILAFFGGISGMIAKDVYLYAKRKFKR